MKNRVEELIQEIEADILSLQKQINTRSQHLADLYPFGAANGLIAELTQKDLLKIKENRNTIRELEQSPHKNLLAEIFQRLDKIQEEVSQIKNRLEY